MPATATHRSPYSGSWYPADAVELEQLIDELWQSSEQRTDPCLLSNGRGFVVPHAGLMYSGTVAAAVYRHLQRQQPERIILMGFAHRGSPPGVFVPDVERFETPLGSVVVDRESVEELLAHRLFRRMSEARLCDHSVEIQLPLLQRATPAARIVPLYVGYLDSASRIEVARKLAERTGTGSVLVASSDLTHYGAAFDYQPFPVDHGIGDRLRDLDYEVIEAAGSLREELFAETLGETGATVCGRDPIRLLLATMRLHDSGGEIFQQILDYQTSGEITGDFHHSVSYGALGYFPYTSFELDEQEQAAVLEIARRALGEYQETGRRPATAIPKAAPGVLNRRCSLFVTLRKSGHLRGCLGRVSAGEPLQALVPELTLSAALEDTRFEAIDPSESGIDIEISLLSPMKRIPRAGDFQVGAHGALLKAQKGNGLLLPQVATGRGWDSAHFLRALARKAGVSDEVYSDPATRLYVFRAQVIR